MGGQAWEKALLDLFDDLEQQAQGLHLADRAEAVAALGEAAYAEVTYADRLLAAEGAELTLRLVGGLVLRGRLVRAAADWGLLEDEAGAAWLVCAGAVAVTGGLGPGRVPESARSPLAGLGTGSVLRRVVAERGECTFHLVDGTTLEGRPLRVGADFVEVTDVAGGLQVISFGALAALRER